MKVVILCGGAGTRLREETEFKPKPLVMVGNKPIIWHIMKIYASQGFNEFILALGYKGELIKEYFINYDFMNSDFTLNLKNKEEMFLHDHKDIEDWKITFADTGLNTKTAGRVKKLQRYLKEEESFMLTYGDGVADINIKELIETHKKNKRIATITGFHPQTKYGIIETEGEIVKRFKEKPILDNLINGGFMVFNKQVFDFIDEDEDSMLVEKTLPKLAEQDQITLYHHKGYWKSMDTYKDYKELNKEYNNGIPWKTW